MSSSTAALSRLATIDIFADEPAGHIYRVAARLIHEQGFDATSMSTIADANELTKAGLYYYVKSKKELLFKISSLVMDLLEMHVIEPARCIAEPMDRLRTIILHHAFLLTHETGPLAILTDEVDGLEVKDRRNIVARKRSYFELVRSTLEELRGQGRLRSVNTTVAAFSLLGMVMWIARWYSAEGPLSREQVAEDIASIALSAVLTGTKPQEIRPFENPS
jgi:AcrR family transcriptional regulator